MPRPLVRLGVRHWDHLTPLALGDVVPTTFELEVSRLDATPDLAAGAPYDAAESSFSRYTLGKAAGDDRLVGLPAFVMSGFRHRCVITRRDSDLRSLDQLRGARVGLTGWPDSGNTWTRALLRREGVELGDVEWFVGPLLDSHPVGERIGARKPANVSRTPDDRSLVDLLVDGTLHAVMTPFMPPGFHDPDSPLRHLLTDYVGAEIAYFESTGFVPGIHLVTMRREFAEAHPDAAVELVEVLDRSWRTWMSHRVKLADTTPWLLSDVDRTAKTIGLDWSPYGARADAMVKAFCAEQLAQDLTEIEPDAATVFAQFSALEAQVRR